jgi:5'/3'-nucleotidase SurE
MTQILLTNDDGIDALGIAVLRRALDGLGDVLTIAPDHNTSAVARGITIGAGSRSTVRRPTACASASSASTGLRPTSSSRA